MCIYLYIHLYVYLLKKQIPHSFLKAYSEDIKIILAEEKGQWKFR